MHWRYSHTVLTLCLLAFFATMFPRLLLSPLVPLLMTEFAISNGDIGLALSLMWLTYALTQFPSGILADRVGERTVILLAVAGTAVVCMGIAIAPDFPVFVGGVLALGAVAGFHYSVATALLSRTSGDIGTAIGIHALGAPLAGLLAPIVTAGIGYRFGWRIAVVPTVVVAGLLAVLLAWGIRPTQPRRPERRIGDALAIGELRALLGRRSVATTVAIAAVSGFVGQGIVSFLPAFLVASKGTSPAVAGVAFGAYFVISTGAQVGVGVLSDRVGRMAAIVTCSLAGMVGIGILLVGTDVVSIAVAVALLGLGTAVMPAIHARFVDDLAPGPPLLVDVGVDDCRPLGYGSLGSLLSHGCECLPKLDGAHI